MERMPSDLDAAVARLRYISKPDLNDQVTEHMDDLCLALKEYDRRGERITEFERLQAVWLMSPEAAKRLDGYRELAAECAALEAERDAARAEVERLQGLLTVTDAALVRTGEQARKAEAEAKFGAGLAQDLSGELARLRERDARVRSILQRVDDEACKTNWSGNTDDLPESRPLDNEAVAMDMREALELLKETP